MANDFVEQLTNRIKSLTSLPVRVGYLSDEPMIAIYSLPGGSITGGFMNGDIESNLNYEIAIQHQDNEIAIAQMWKINEYLSDFHTVIDSGNGSYDFEELKVDKPYLDERDEQGMFTHKLSLTATIIDKKENN